MGRGKAKGKRLNVTNQDDTGSGEEEKIPSQKKRGRPQKSLKDEIDEGEAQIVEGEESEDTTEKMQNKDVESRTLIPSGKKQKMNSQTKENIGEVKEGNDTEIRSSTEKLNKSNGFRQNGNRRKSKPHRAAEAVVECN